MTNLQRVGTVLITGGAGFIGSNFARLLLEHGVPNVRVLDALTYAGNRSNLADLERYPGFCFIEGDIRDPKTTRDAMGDCEWVVHFAAETHVDRSLLDAADFVQTNVYGTYVLVEAARGLEVQRFVHVSTDEVYGDIPIGYSSEDDRLDPRSPYSASKAGAEMMVFAYVETYGLPAVITRGSNTYGPYQHPEKFIPLMITNALEGKPLPVYGDGQQVRDWIHVHDHCTGILTALLHGHLGAAYNIGGGQERHNLEVVHRILTNIGAPVDLIQHVEDRVGHDRRYALDATRLRALGWSPTISLTQGLRETIAWYREHPDWWEPLKQARFSEYYQDNYGSRTVLAGAAGLGDDR